MIRILLVGLGGSVGAISRYLATEAVYHLFEKSWLPYGTMAVNIVGCFLIGFLGGFSEIRQMVTPETRLLVFVGFLGGFTTFSSFEFEVFQLTRNAEFFAAFVNVALQVIIGFGAVWFGHTITKLL